MSEKELIEYVVQGDFRPQIPAATPPKMKELIRSCWQKDPGKRPNIKDIVEVCDSLDNL